MIKAKAKSTVKKPIYNQIDGYRIAIINDDKYREYPESAYEMYKHLLVKEKIETDIKSETKEAEEKKCQTK